MVGRIQIEISYCIAFISLLYFGVSCTQRRDTTDLLLYQTDSIRSGDIILRKGYGLVSELITAELNDTVDISHCGILVQDSAAQFWVIHSLSRKVSDADGVQMCSLDRFMADSRTETVRVVRFKYDGLGLVSERAKAYLRLKIPFDEKFDMGDTTAFFCSEMPIHIIKNAYKTDVSVGMAKPKFSVFLNTEFFTEIDFVKKRLY